LGRLQAVALVEDPGLIERQQTEFAQLDAVRTLAVRVAAVQDDAAGGVDHGAHAAVDGAGELDLIKAQRLDALGLLLEAGLGEGNGGRVLLLERGGHRRAGQNRETRRLDSRPPATGPARSGQIGEGKLRPAGAGTICRRSVMMCSSAPDDVLSVNSRQHQYPCEPSSQGTRRGSRPAQVL